MRVEGKLVKILTQETGVSKANKEWKKQSIVIEQDTEYNKEVVITYFGDNINKLQAIKLGDIISCNVNLSSREFNGKYYHNIDGWSCSLNGNNLEAAAKDDLPF
tara:strand:+ start:754 stop:1065 length:312 start_codon:yes stop_codon:yes gene_type:complete